MRKNVVVQTQDRSQQDDGEKPRSLEFGGEQEEPEAGESPTAAIVPPHAPSTPDSQLDEERESHPKSREKVDVPKKERGLPGPVRRAVISVRKCWALGKKAGWREIWAIGRLAEACERAAMPYLEVARLHLSPEGEQFSKARISSRRWAYAYCRRHGIAKLPNDLSCLPHISLVVPFSMFGRRPKLEQEHQEELARLHERVFSRKVAERPTVIEVREQIARLLAPPVPLPNPDDNGPIVTETIIDQANLQSWFEVMAVDGKLRIAKLAVASLDEGTISLAIQANREAIRNAQFLRLEVRR